MLKRIWKLLDAKALADNDDNQLGYTLQSSAEFLIEAHLGTSFISRNSAVYSPFLPPPLREIEAQNWRRVEYIHVVA